MAKNPLIANAMKTAKEIGVRSAGWGHNNVVFFEPETDELMNELKKKMALFGLTLVEDEKDKEARLVTFTDGLHAQLPNIYAGKKRIWLMPTKARWLVIPVASIFMLAAILIWQLDEFGMYLFSIMFFLAGFVYLRKCTASFILEKDHIIYRTLLRRDVMPIAEIKSIRAINKWNSDDLIEITMADGRIIKTLMFFFVYANLAKDAIETHVKKPATNNN